MFYFEEITNALLEKYNHPERVDCRTLKDQRAEALMEGDHFKAQILDREPEKHLGPAAALQEKNPEVEAVKLQRKMRQNKQDLLYEIEMTKQDINERYSKDFVQAASIMAQNLLHLSRAWYKASARAL